MSEEEQEALMYLKQCVISNIPFPSEALSWVKTIINLIDKLQEENKELEKTIEKLENTIVELSTTMEE